MRLRNYLKSKIHRAVVTMADLNYNGSITIDKDLCDRVDLAAGELVHVWNVENGARFETYVIEAPRGSGIICVNGAAAHLVTPGDCVIIAAFELADEQVTPKMILVDKHNRYERDLPWTEQAMAITDQPLSA
jgi:aspartate 1-decarboxylase